jgi:hypothetical protein
VMTFNQQWSVVNSVRIRIHFFLYRIWRSCWLDVLRRFVFSSNDNDNNNNNNYHQQKWMREEYIDSFVFVVLDGV